MPKNNDTTPNLILHTKNIMKNIKQVELIPDLGSDHLGFKIQFDLTQNTPEEEIRKCNFNKCIIEKVNKEIVPLTKENITKFNNTLSEAIT